MAHAAPAPRGRLSTEALVLLSCGANALITTIHHVRGALLYGTPERYHAVLLAAAMLTVVAIAFGIGRAGDSRVRRLAWWAFWAASLIGFVVLFGLVEGLVTHVIGPIVEGYAADEPFDLLFELTGVLHTVPAAVTAALLARLLRERRGAGHDHRAVSI